MSLVYMYLIHNTTPASLKRILMENKLKASYLTGKLNEGEDIYKSKDQKYVFFSVVDKLKSKYKIYGDVILYFDNKMLWNRSYYVSTVHTPTPHVLGDKRRKYKQYYKSTNRVLTKLFENAISQLPDGKAFQVFQQVAIYKQCDLKYLKKIKFLRSKPTNVIIKLIKKRYPDVILDF